MKFEMNNRTWEIKELSQEEIRKHIVDYKHELAHCYIGSFITNQDDKSYSEEDVVDIVSNSYFVILEIVIEYLMEKGRKKNNG